LQLWGTTTTEHFIQWGDGTSGSDTYRGAISYSHASDFMRFWTSSTEQMRLTSTGLEVKQSQLIGYSSYAGIGTNGLAVAGNVGIGTSSPGEKLDVVGGIRALTASTSANTLRVGNTGNSTFLGVESSTGGANIVGSTAYATTLTSNGPIQLSTNNGASVQATLDSTGLGIGTSSPASLLTVSKNQNATTRVLISNTDTTNGSSRGNLLVTGGTVETVVTSVAGDAGYIGTGSNHPLEFITNGSGRMRITSGGDFLVGATSAYLSTFSGITAEGKTSGVGNNLSLGLYKAGTPQILNGDVLGNIYFYGVDNDITAGNNNIGARIASIATTDWTTDGTTSNAALVFYTHGTTSGAPEERARITSGGDVGIGTSSPIGRLEAVGGTGAGFSGWFRTGDATAANNAGGGFYNTSSATAASRQAVMALDADGANLGGGDYFVIQKNGNNGTADILQYSSAAMRFGTNYTARATYDMILDSAGNVGIGTSSITSSFKLDVVGVGGARFSDVAGDDGVELGWSAGGSAGFVQAYDRGASAFRDLILNNAVTISSSGNVGIGASPPSAKLQSEVSGSTAQLKLTQTSYASYNFKVNTDSSLTIDKDGTTRLTVDSAGNFGLGVAPSAWSAGKGIEVGFAGNAVYSYSQTDFEILSNAYYDSGYKFGGTGQAMMYAMGTAGSGIHSWHTSTASGDAGDPITFTQAMTLDASGNLLVAATTSAATNNTDGFRVIAGGIPTVQRGAAGSFAIFYNYSDSAIIGSITNSGGVSTLFNTTSDYRLKTVTGAVTGQGARIDALEPVEYTWNSDGSRSRGFLAHKFQEVYASSVNGTKDAVDKDGKPLYQSMQAGSSEVIADLVAEIQSLRQRLAAAGI
jgi:hypothetical protein